ncbi:hypothetical protein ABPG74_007575 [Tetrahymena malaccensis]
MMQQEFNIDDLSNEPRIKVVIRKRPVNKKEQAKSDVDIIEVKTGQSVIVKEMKQKVDLTKYVEEHLFNFDHAFGENCTNEEVYMTCVRPIVTAAFQRARVTCFAYGQTGSGKTHTMLGSVANRVPGMYVLASHDIFTALQRPQFSHLQIFVSFYEIYCGKLFDLLNDRQILHPREDGKQNINIIGLMEQRITNVDQLLKIIEFGMSARVTAQNSANTDSSRSHAILQIQLKEQNNVYGKISFIDLAGSERGADVIDQNKQTRKDGAEINKSLLALKECIRALDQGKNYTPFRGSKLTLVLKDSFTGNCRTVMIGNISPCQSNSEHTLNTLRYADRVKELKKPTNQDLSEQVNQLDSLAQQLMLPRQSKNIVRRPVVENNNENNIPNSNHKLEQLMKSAQNTNFAYNLPQQQNNFPAYQPQTQAQQPRANYNNFMAGDQMGNNNNNILSAHNNNALNPNLNANNMYPGSQSEMFDIEPRQLNKTPQQQQQFTGIKMGQQPQSQQQYRPQSNNQLGFQNQMDQNTINSQTNPINLNIEQIENWTARNEEDLQLISQKHEQLISLILAEEEDVIASHRSHIDDMVELTKQEMMLLHDVDKPASDVDVYVQNLDAILQHKSEIINMLRQRLQTFRSHLKKEELLSKKFYEQRAQIMDVFDLNSNTINPNNDEMQLLDDLPDLYDN